MNQPRGLLKLLKVDSLITNISEYVETRIAIVKAEAKDDVMKAMRAAMIFGSIAVLGLFFLLFLSLTIALALNTVLDSWFWGFAIVTGVYLIILVVLYSLRNSEKVKMMFGDGSLQFLKKQPKKEPSPDEEREKELEREAAVYEKEREAEIKHEKVTFTGREPSPNVRPAEIKVEKKETH